MSLYIAPRTPLTNFPDDSPPNVFAISIASLIATLEGMSSFSSSSNIPILKIFLSTFVIWSRGHSVAYLTIFWSISSRLLTTPSIIFCIKVMPSNSGAKCSSVPVTMFCN